MTPNAMALAAVDTYIGCEIKVLPAHQWIEAANTAVGINPANAPAVEMLGLAASGEVIPPDHLALLTAKYWGSGGAHLTVGFLDNPPLDLRIRILNHMNAWAAWANVSFSPTGWDPQVRIARIDGVEGGYWSYHGTDILGVAPGSATMNLEGFTMSTDESEFVRVIRHETGHTLGFPHEHRRTEIVNRIDKAKAIAYFQATQNWDAAKTTQQVLTPLDDSALIKTALADDRSIMCYGLPGSIMKDGVPVPGGADIDESDGSFAASVYPKAISSSVRKNSPIGVTSWGPDRIDVFGLGTDDAMYHQALGRGGVVGVGGAWREVPQSACGGVVGAGPDRRVRFGYR